MLFGSAVRVSSTQLPHIDQMLRKCAADMKLTELPTTFVVGSNGAVNALAVRFLRARYVILYSELVDLLPERQLSMVIAHEVAHHAAGHINFWKSLLMKPAIFVPFLGAAYSRACELTADRIAAVWVGDAEASKAALVAIACGSARMAPQVNTQAFREQEAMVPAFFGFLMKLFSTHPRMTRRVIEIEDYFQRAPSHLRAPTLSAVPAE